MSRDDHTPAEAAQSPTTERAHEQSGGWVGPRLLRAVVEHYNQTFSLGLGEQAKKDLVEYLKSLAGRGAGRQT